MLEGIVVLSQSEAEVVGWGFNWCALLFLLLGIVLVIATFALGENDDNGIVCVILAILSGVSIGFSVVSFMTAKVVDTYPIYKVTIDNSVSLQEFNDRYEIIEQDGSIYTIKEKGE